MAQTVTMAHGAGGSQMDSLIKDHILRHFTYQGSAEVPLQMLDDAAVVDDIVFSTDSHTVCPLIFPGGNIGTLAVCGTINDVSVVGARPLALSAGFIVEEGFALDTMDVIVSSMGKVAKAASVPIVTGDTKVVERGAVQGFMINTSGIGKRCPELDTNLAEVRRFRPVKYRWLLDANLKDGDVLIASGLLGEHGIALLSFREGYGFETKVTSDVAALNGLMGSVLRAGGVVSAKDPTRGGLANTVNEFAAKSKVGLILEEEALPISEGVRAACDLLGIDPLEIGNEGKVVLGVVKEKAEEVLAVLHRHPLGRHAAIIGKASRSVSGVVLDTAVGGRRILQQPLGDPVPRIC